MIKINRKGYHKSFKIKIKNVYFEDKGNIEPDNSKKERPIYVGPFVLFPIFENLICEKASDV
jgi:hypothetical protein